MRYLSHRAGPVVGVSFGIFGLVAGLLCSWLGFESQPHTVFAGGVFLGALGAFAGLVCAFFGIVLRRTRQA